MVVWKNDQQAGRGKDEKKSADEPKRVVKVVRVIRRVVQKVVTSDADKTSSKDVLKFFSHASKLHPVSVTDDENKNFPVTEKLWKFNKMEAEKIYLFKQLLSKPWKANQEHLRQFREELLYDPKRRPHMVIASQKNTNADSVLRFYITSKTQRHEFNNGTHFLMNESVYNSFPHNSPFRHKRFKKCSLVGNSGSLLNNSCGEEIDDADFVFRFGGLASDRNLSHFLHHMKEYSGYLWFPCLSSHRYTDLCLNASFFYNNTENQFVVGHPEHFKAIWQFWKDRNVTKIISTGARHKDQ
eukprot:XP_011682826.1 PREDICTED: alpha-2,8-sialyltransferase 8E [Strongylocentrotus purpuratus]